MEELLEYFPNTETREILSWLGGGLVVIVSGIWAAFKYRSDAKEKSESAHAGSTPTVTADRGSVAIGGDAIDSSISINNKL